LLDLAPTSSQCTYDNFITALKANKINMVNPKQARTLFSIGGGRLAVDTILNYIDFKQINSQQEMY